MSLPVRNSIFKTTGYCAALLLLFTGAASAQTQKESFNTSDSLKGRIKTANNFVLPGFDTTQGNREGADVTLKFSSCSSIRDTNASITEPTTIDGPACLDLNTSLAASHASDSYKPEMNNFWTMESSMTDTRRVTPGDFKFWENQPDNQVSLTITKGKSNYRGTDPRNDLFFGGNAKECGDTTAQYTCLGSSGTLAVPEPPAKCLSTIVAAAMMMLIFMRRKNLLNA